MSEASQDYAEAPRFPLPGTKYFSVEYPGYVKNMNKVMETLGGQRALNRAVNNDQGMIELRYRPNDPLSHPINGDIKDTANLLLKVTRYRRKDRMNVDQLDEDEYVPPDEYKTEVMGVITHTCRFRGMADFQYLGNPSDPLMKLRLAMVKGDLATMTNFEMSAEDDETEDAPNIPPPVFSQTEIPHDYGYRQSTSVIKVMVQRNENEPPVVKLINKSKRKRIAVTSMNFEDPNIPEGPAISLLKELMPKSVVDRIQELFQKRPIWTRLALLNQLTPEEKKHSKRILPLISYHMNNGPWRDCWVRYGVDPRKDPAMRFYQLLDVRSSLRPKNTRAQRTMGGAMTQSDMNLGSGTRGGGDDSDEDTGPIKKCSKDLAHIFDGVNKPRETAIFQLCDISDPQLRPLIESKSYVRNTCNKEDGFYDLGMLTRLRKVVRRKFEAFHAQQVPEPENYVQYLESEIVVPEGEEEEDMGGELGLNESHEANGQLSDKVHELMRNLRRAQQQTVNYEDDYDEVDEYEDVLGDDSEESEEAVEE